jgi:hypothetical protein
VAQNQRLVKGLVQDEDGFGLVGASITSPGENATAVTGQGGAFEIRVSPYAKKIVATHEGYLSEEAEIDGSMIILRLKADKKYAEKKAKADAEAARAEKEETERIAKEKAEAERAAKAEADRLAKEEAKDKANKVKEQSKASVTMSQNVEPKEKPSRKAEKMKSESSGGVTGYEQYLGLSFLSYNGLEYIGGYRFNHHFFLGLGTGLGYLIGEGGLMFPFNVNLRVNFSSKKKWSPYCSILTGTRYDTSDGWYLPFVSSVDFGMKKDLREGKALYFGAGLFTATNFDSVYAGLKFNFGFSF